MRPEISVILPVFNGEAFLAEAVDSIRRQNWPPLEVILVDDGSTDGTADLARSLGDPIRVVRQSNAGPAMARNLGLSLARGEWIAFLDADDLWPEGKLRVQAEALTGDPDLDVSAGYTRVVKRDDRPGADPRWPEIRGRWLGPQLGSLLCRRSAFDRVGPFNAGLRFAEDMDWLIRARDAGLKLRILDHVTLIYRLHGGNMVRDHSEMNAWVLRVLRQSIRRRPNGASDFDGLFRTPIPPAAADKPLVSVIIPVFNGERLLAETVASALRQDYKPLEILIVDDGSADGTAGVARSFGPDVRYLRQENAGPAAARNRGAQEASGEYLAFLDSDDLWAPEKISRQVAILERQAEAGYAGCRLRPFLDEGLSWPATFNRAYYESEPEAFIASSLLMRKSVWLKVGEFRPSYRLSDDAEWLFQARDKGLVAAMAPEVLLFKRIHSGNISHQAEEAGRELLKGLRESLRRRTAK